MTDLDKILSNAANPKWWTSTAIPYMINKGRRKVINAYGEGYYKMKGIESVSVLDEDWDNLIILDACRYDTFKEEYEEEGCLQLKYSKGPQTPIFLQKNFGDGNYYDVIYITANPHVKMVLSDDQFYKVYHIWKTEWNDNLKTVHPEDAMEVASRVAKEYPHKRLIIHFMQPHTPFIGPWARENIGVSGGFEHARDKALSQYNERDISDPVASLKSGAIEATQVRKAYRENLNIALRYVDSLLADFTGKTVITGDHGELFGEYAWPYPWKDYSHPYIMAEKLLQVPWLVIDSDERKSIESEPPTENPIDLKEKEIKEKLSHLGYR